MATSFPDIPGISGVGSSSALFELWTGSFSGRDLAVVSFQCREAISRSFCLDAFVHVPASVDLLEAPILGQAATFVIQRPDVAPRIFQGMVEAIEPHAASSTKDWSAYRIRVVPRLRLLKWRTTSRIFQDLTVPDIVAAVLAQVTPRVAASWKLSRPYPVRSYCLQHQESDLAFVERLLAEEGIFYYVAHPTEVAPGLTETIVFLDDAQGYPPIDADGGDGVDTGASPELVVRPAESMRASTDDSVQTFSLKRTLRSNATLLRDYDFRRPLLDMRSQAALDAGAPGAGPEGLRVYTHRGDYDEPEVTPVRAQTALEQHRRRAAEGAGESTCRRLAPGHRFTLQTDTPYSLTGEYVVTHVEHVGHTPERSAPGARPYHARFRCVPASVPYRPKRTKPRLRQVLESAKVVGPAGADIHTDLHGRIKVQFPWDLQGNDNERSSCWIRVVQAWAGSSWGFQFIPRVGMEVMVSFLGGDQDTPIILGCTYNATHPTTFALPIDKTRSGIRTQSTPASGGSNELSFEDKAGGEQVYLHAQRDLDEVVGRNHSTSVSGNQSISVTGNIRETVAGHRIETVTGNAVETIGATRLLTVTGSEKATIVGDAALVVKSQRTVAVEQEYNVTVGTTEKDATATLDVHGDYALTTSGSVRVVAKGSIRLTCGTSLLEITPDEIRLDAKAITLVGTSSVSMEGKGPSLHLTDKVFLGAKKIILKSSQASLELDEEAKLKGKTVKLNCDGPDDLDDDGKKKPDPIAFQTSLLDDFHKPYVGKKYTLLVDGKVFDGETDGDGNVKQDISPEAASAELTLWLGEKDKDPRRKWQLTLSDLPPLDTPHGVRRRLKNLGYYRVNPNQKGSAQAEAITAFQKDHGLDPTGKLDDATKAKLGEVHGG